MEENMYTQMTKQRAFTLIELLAVISIIAIVTSIAIPSFQSFIFTNRISTTTSALHGALLLTRSEAIKRGAPVTICRSENADSLNPTCSASNSNAVSNTGWGSGWIIFVDLNRNGVYEPGNNPAETLIRVQGQLIRTTADGSIIPVPQRKYITYGATGQTFGNFMRFAINRPNADSNVDHDRFICISSGGRARVDKTLCTNN
ncbi:MAG: GspH/FimT family pseudopilin [Burkholderiales bacterium]|nr:GspH/FimT family pseudopilin [Burkholderiales bacterium]